MICSCVAPPLRHRFKPRVDVKWNVMSNSCLLVSQRTECDCFTVSCAAVRSSCVVCQMSHTNAIDSITHSEPNRMEWTRICFNGYSSGACPHTRSTPNGLLFQKVVAGQEETQRTLNTKICRLDFFTSRSPGVHSLQMSSGVILSLQSRYPRIAIPDWCGSRMRPVVCACAGNDIQL